MGLDVQITNKLKFLGSLLDKEIETRMKKASLKVHGELVRILRGERTGRIYRVPATKKRYRASRAGEPPASRTGDLRTSYRWKVEGTGVDSYGVVGSPLKYAYYLEKGTRKIKPRPHLSVAMRKSKKDVEKIFEGLI